MPDFSNARMGLIHTPPADRVRRYSALFRRDVPPRTCDWHRACALDPIDALGNYEHGCCVEAGYFRMAQIRKANAQGATEYRPTEDKVLAAYSRWAGFDPATGLNDAGTRIDVAMQEMAAHGLDVDGQAPEVALPVLLDHADKTELQLAVHRLGTVGLCLALPLCWQSADIWDAPIGREADETRPGGWGMHFVPSGRYEANGQLFVCITWGQEMILTWHAVQRYCVSAHSQVAPSWLQADGRTPTGLTRDELKIEAARLAG